MKTYINGYCIEQVLTNAVELTTAQYNALSTEQKNHGTYIITDAEAPNISATQVDYTSDGVTTTVNNVLDDVLLKNELDPTIKGALYIDKANGTVSEDGYSALVIGNDKASGTAGNSKGSIYMYSNSDKYVRIYTPTDLSNNRNISLPLKVVHLLE